MALLGLASPSKPLLSSTFDCCRFRGRRQSIEPDLEPIGSAKRWVGPKKLESGELMKRVQIIISGLAVVLLASQAWAQQEYSEKRFWLYASPRIEIKQTGEAAREHNQSCGSSGGVISA